MAATEEGIDEFRVQRGARGAPSRRSPIPPGEVAEHRGPSPDGDDRRVRPGGMGPDGEPARPSGARHPRGLRGRGVHPRGADGRVRGDGRGASVRAVLLDRRPRRERAALLGRRGRQEGPSARDRRRHDQSHIRPHRGQRALGRGVRDARGERRTGVDSRRATRCT